MTIKDTMQPTRKHYIDNKEFFKKICEYHETKVISDELWMMFFKLAENYANLSSFRGYSYIDDMKMEAMMRCIRYINSFDHLNKNNPFSYFTTVVHNSFIAYLNKEKTHQNKKWKDLRIVYEQYIAEYGIEITLPDNIMKKIYQD